MKVGKNFSFPTQGEKRQGEYRKKRQENDKQPTGKAYRKFEW